MQLNCQGVTQLPKMLFYGYLDFRFRQDEIHPTQLQSSENLFLAEQVSWAPCLGKGKQVTPAECTPFQQETGVRNLDLPALKKLLIETFPCTCRWITIQLDFHALDEPDRDFPSLGRIRLIQEILVSGFQQSRTKFCNSCSCNTYFRCKDPLPDFLSSHFLKKKLTRKSIVTLPKYCFLLV